jgi:glucose/arabinose dehydrogenase
MLARIPALALAFTLALAPLAGCSGEPQVASANDTGDDAQTPPATQTGEAMRVDTIARGLSHPWSVALLPDGTFLVTERSGNLRRVDAQGTISAPIAGVPDVFAQGQGGLLDVVLAPDFATTRGIYLSYAEPGENDTAGTAVARATLNDTTLTDVRVI